MLTELVCRQSNAAAMIAIGCRDKGNIPERLARFFACQFLIGDLLHIDAKLIGKIVTHGIAPA